MTKFFFDDRFPAKVIATAPVTVTKSGTTYTVGLEGGTAGILPAGSVDMWKIKRQLVWQSKYDVVEAAVSAATNDPVNLSWSNGGYSIYGDGVSDLIKTATGWTDPQVQAFYAAAALLTRGTHSGDL